MKRLLTKGITLAFFLLGSTALVAQTSSDLKRRRASLDKQIDYTNKLLSETRNDQRMSQTELILLNKQITLREAKINNLSSEIRSLDQQIAEKQSVIDATEEDLARLREEYARMIANAWKSRSTNDKLLYVFSAGTLDQAYRRLKYMQSYVAERDQLKADILALQEFMGGDIEDLEAKKAERTGLIVVQETDRTALSADKQQQEQTYSALIRDEQRLRAQLTAQRRDKNKLNEAIAYALKKEIEAERNRNSGAFKLTPEARLVSSRFEKNKGKLPWPVERGVITSSFGEHPHPTISGVKIQNNGIDITTNKSAAVRAIFEGEVISVITISGAGKTVMIKHGGYYTAYSNLKDVKVTRGEKVTTKEIIGTLLESGDSKKSISHFEIWKIGSSGVMSKENPASWIYNK